MSTDALDLLRAHDPARLLRPLDDAARRAQCELVMSDALRRKARGPRRKLRVAAAVAAVLAAVLVVVGAAWACGLLSPLAVFENNAQRDGSPPGSIWDQSVDPGTVRLVASVQVPDVGAVGFWYARTTRGGWCGALRLPNADWLGTGKSPLDAGGTVPGCYPTRSAVNSAAKTPVYVLNGFDYQEADVDARPLGGSYWRIRFGRIDAPGAVEVVDRASGASAPIENGLFELAIADPDPTGRGSVHLVAVAADGDVVADDCPSCGP
jgi:hypothetical protein